jgi:hypothetical protein
VRKLPPANGFQRQRFPEIEGAVSRPASTARIWDGSRVVKPIEVSNPTLTFAQKIEHEFIVGSAIKPNLYRANIRLVSDTESDISGEVCYPIHEALNWHVTRFGHQSRDPIEAALIQNEDGSTFQAKLNKPRFDKEKNTVRKYESPVGGGALAYLPFVPVNIRQAIADRCGEQIPSTGSFWDWVADNPSIQIVVTEGGKKALALFSLAHVAISIFGCNGGYRVKDQDGNQVAPYLIPQLERFAVPGREFILAFDQDAKLETRYRVKAAVSKFGELLAQKGCVVKIATWQPEQGKGIDDLIVQSGSKTALAAIDDAVLLADWTKQNSRSLLQYQAKFRIENSLKLPPKLSLKAQDLSKLELGGIPQSGIVAIKSPKGTGKTKFTNQLTQDSEKVLAAGHRRVLMRNLAQRLGLNYIGDIDKVNGRFFAGTAYTLRLSFCVDSLLAINPKDFEGCDLAIDEVIQVLRHLLQSSTCNKDGMRPALLGIFQELIQTARRVIVADADLDDASLEYLQALRGDGQPVYLIRNDIHQDTYPCQFIECNDASAITAELIEDAKNLAESWRAIDSELATGIKKAIWITTDTKAGAKRIAKALEEVTGLKALVIHSETSGDGAPRALICNPDDVIAGQQYAFYVCSPSVGTGVSIEIPDHFAAVYGLFSGYSLDDGDIAQALARVREPVKRVVWVARYGRAFNKVSRSTKPKEIDTALKQRTDVTVRLIRSQLKPDTVAAIEEQDWAAPHIKLYSHQAANQNWSQFNLRDAVLVRLQCEGAIVTVEETPSNKEVKSLLKQTTEQINLIEAEEICNARDLNLSEALELEAKEVTSPEDRAAVTKFNLKDFYKVDKVDIDFVLADRKGRRRAEILSLEAQIDDDVAVDRTVKALEKSIGWAGYICPWDISNTALRVELRRVLGLNDFFDLEKTWTAADLKSYADQIRQYSKEIKDVLGLTISDKMSDVQLVHQLLAQLGVKCARDKQITQKVPGQKNKRIRVYKLDNRNWQDLTEVIERRKQSRAAAEVDSQTEVIPSTVPAVQSKVDIVSDWANRFTSAETDSELRAAFTEIAQLYPERKHPTKQAVWKRLDRALKLRIEQLIKLEAVAA